MLISQPNSKILFFSTLYELLKPLFVGVKKFNALPDPENPHFPADREFSGLHPQWRQRLRSDRPTPSTEELLSGILAGDRVALGRAITLIESQRSDQRESARQLVEACLPQAGRSIRIGITGSPGVGKSTFIEAFGLYLLQQGRKVAVLAVDPSSRSSKGSILGDKTRMEELGRHSDAFVRPSPAGDSLGGVAQKTREAIYLCEAAGYDAILVETVGVGQSETAVHSMVDFFLLLLLPGAGDELQGIKRGIVEMADLLVVNKTDGDRVEAARQTQRAYRNALHLFPAKESGQPVQVLTCSALQPSGMAEVWKNVVDFQQSVTASGYFEERRRQQAAFWLEESIQRQLREWFDRHPEVRTAWAEVRQKVAQGEWSSFKGAAYLLDLFKQ